MSKKTLKRSLALSALMVFVITGSAMAADYNTQQVLEGEDITFTGKTFTCESIYGSNSTNYGGAIESKVDLTLNKSVFDGNSLTRGGEVRGGAIYVWTGSTLTIENKCEFINNSVKNTSGRPGTGGAIHFGENTNSNIKDSLFKNNVAIDANDNSDMGGAIYFSQGSHIVDNCRFIENKGAEGGAFVTNHGEVTVKDSYFEGNEAPTQCGGAINIQGSDGKVTLEGNNEFINNKAKQAGGAIKVYSVNTLDINGTATFTGNTVNGVANDISNDGTVNINEGAVVTLNGGMDGTGTTKVDGTLALGNDSTMGALAGTGGSIVKAEGATGEVTLSVNNTKESTNTVIKDSAINLTGVDLVINSYYNKESYSNGMIANTNIESDSDVTINQNGSDMALGRSAGGTVNPDVSSIKAKELTVNANAGVAVYAGQNADYTLTADTIILNSCFADESQSSAGGINAFSGGRAIVNGFNTLDINVTSNVVDEGGYGIIANAGSEVSVEGNEGSEIFVDSAGRGALIALAAGKLNIETGNLTAGATALEGGEVRKNSTIGAQGAGSKVDITATGNVIVKVDKEGMNAIGADAGASVFVDAGGNVDIDGQVEGSGKSGGKRANITINGNNVNIDTIGEDAVRGFVSNIIISADNELNITSKDKDAVQSVVSKIELNAKKVNLTAGYDGWGINATGDAGNDVDVNAETINIKGELGGVRNLAKSTVDLNATDIKIDAGENEALRATNNGIISVSASNSAVVTGNITAVTGGNVTINFDGAESFLKGTVITDDTSKTTLEFNNGATWNVTGTSRASTFNSNQGKIAFENDSHVHVDAGNGSVILTEANKTADDLNTVAQLSTVASKFGVAEAAKDTIAAKVVMAEGDVKGETTGVVTYKETAEDGYFHGLVAEENVTEKVNTKNQSIGEAGISLKLHYRSHMNDMNKRMGELRNANGEHGVWTRMVRGESEYENTKAQYNQYQLGYDEKLSVDKRWTVGAAVTFAEGDSNYGNGSTDDKSTAFAIYGSKLNNDGTFVDLIARYAHLESDFDDRNSGKGDYSTNGMSVSAEFGKRIQQGKGLWIEPQVELTYGTVDSAEFQLGSKTVTVGDMDSLIGRVGFSLGKDIKQGNVYARASYLYDFDGETENTFSNGTDSRTIKEDLGGGWWEVGVGANINLSKATYIYADVEKTFGGEVDTNWQWNLGVRYSF